MKNNVMSFFLALFLLLMVACRGPVVYEKTIHFDQRGWHLADTAQYDVRISDTTQVLDMGLTFTHTDNYPYSNIWIFLTIEGPKGVHMIDTLDLYLAEHDGRWLGRRKGGDYEVSVLYRHHIKMAQPGDYRFSVIHGMRRERLPHIEALEFWVQKGR